MNLSGNTIILGLSTAKLPTTQPLSYATTLTSLGSFLVGSYLTFFLSRTLSPALTRLKVILLFLAQFLLLVLAAALCSAPSSSSSSSSTTTTTDDDSNNYLVPQDLLGGGHALHNPLILTALPPLAFQSGIQIATSRILGFNELPVNVLTSSYADFTGDPNLFRWRNEKRNRRLGGMLGVLVGAIVAAWMMRKGVRVGDVLWVAAALKGVVVVGVWGGVRAEEVKVETEVEERREEREETAARRGEESV